MAQTLAPLIYVLAFIAIVLAVQSVAGVVFCSRDQNQRINGRLTMVASGMQHPEVYSTLVRRPLTAAGQNVFFLRLYDRFALYCRQGGLEASPFRALSIVGVL